jgi:hypothetical protein
MIERTEETLGLKPNLLAADTAYGTGRFLHWLIGTGISPHIPVWDMSTAPWALANKSAPFPAVRLPMRFPNLSLPTHLPLSTLILQDILRRGRAVPSVSPSADGLFQPPQQRPAAT